MAQPGGSNVPPWNKGRKVGQKRALHPQEVWLIRNRLRAEGRFRDLALFNLALAPSLPAVHLVSPQFSEATEVSLPQPDRFEIASFRAAIFSPRLRLGRRCGT